MEKNKILVTDFDGTISKTDFYSVVVDRFLSPGDLNSWKAYEEGEITHFEALRQIFEKIKDIPVSELITVFEEMNVEPELKKCISELQKADWEVVVVSNGSDWYINQIFEAADIDIPVHSNPGKYAPETGLEIFLPVSSPFFCADVGIAKGKVVQHYQNLGYRVVFSGDGHPDIVPAMLVSAGDLFATGWLATELEKENEEFKSFNRWKDIADKLLSERN